MEQQQWFNDVGASNTGNCQKRWETKTWIRGGGYGEHYGIKDTGSYSNSLRTQATSKLTSTSAVQFVKGYRLNYVCHGFVQAQTWRRSEVRLVLPNV
jgi:hypothetical protein